jgi:Na+-translocating ferredoxin:NAD+ oxidoreductase RnfG subunit
VNEALAALRGESVAPQPTAAPVPTASPDGRTAKATKEGYESPIEAIITLDDAGKIIGITVGENASFDETEGLGAKVKDDAFKAQFIGKTGPFEVGKNIDAIAGATYSSKGVVEAVNAALVTLGSEPAKETISNTETTATDGKTGTAASTNAPDVKPSTTTAAPVPMASPDGRTAKAIKDGFESPIEVIITLDDAGKIIGITVGENASFDETKGLGSKVKEDAFKAQFIGKTGPFKLGESIDAVSGATFSSQGVVDAVNAALESLAK